MPQPKLTPKQALFCKEYLVDLNATQAAIRAKYSKKTAKQQGTENLAKPIIQQEIERLMQKRSEKVEITADWVLNRLVEEAEADFGDIYDDKGALRPVNEWPKIWRQGLVSGLDVQDGTLSKIKLSDRLNRIKLIGEHIGVGAFKQMLGFSGDGITFNLNFDQKDAD